jgi:broad specificity phosphatase PhoE
MRQRWPERLWVVRHGESAGNVARDRAHAAGLPMIDVDGRDVDVPLSGLGEQQAAALGRWFAAMPPETRPDVVLSSPYARARRTAEILCAEASIDSGVITDERLREKEFGVLDRLTRAGIVEREPAQAEFRRLLGKFYHRPPGGESWCDVILRLRSALDSISLHHSDRRVLVVAHQVVVLCLRYVLENLAEDEILAIDRQAEVANCGVCEWVFEPDCPQCEPSLTRWNFVAPLAAEGTPVTAAPDVQAGAR